MKTLEKLNIARLSHLEFGQHCTRILSTIRQLGGGSIFITDEILNNYLTDFSKAIDDYNKALLQVQKSDETKKIATADHWRDQAIVAFRKQLAVHEISDVIAERLAYDSLHTLMNSYKGMAQWNFEEETSGIVRLIEDLASNKYAPSITLLGMQRYVERIASTQAAFDTLFEGRTQELVHKEVYDVKALRKTLKSSYEDLATYLLAMAKAHNTPQFNESLDVINTVRKYFSDLLAKRSSSNTPSPVI